jgi:biopolymer transport protein ExbD
MPTTSRAKAARAARRTAQFAKFRIIQLNLVPLVDTFVAIVFFSLTTAAVGELAPVMPGVRLPESRVGANALQELTLGIGSQVTLGGRPIMTTAQAASAQSDNPAEPMLIPQLYSALRAQADSIRSVQRVGENQSVKNPLAIQGDRTMRYAVLARVMHTARLAGFQNLSLQVNRVQDDATPRRPAN